MDAPLPAIDRFVRRGALGCAGLLLVACLGLAIPLYSLSRRGANVEAAVQASFPAFCSEWRDSIRVSPSPYGLFTAWDVSCESGFLGLKTTPWTVNVLTCEAKPHWEPSLSLKGMYHALVATGRKMAVCP